MLPPAQHSYLDFLNVSNTPVTSFAFELVIPDEVKQEISRIPNGKSHGLYSCPTKILKSSANVISSTLTQIINLSISTGVYPKKLKMAKIIPIFKADDNTDANTYMPISLLSNFNRNWCLIEWNLSLRKIIYFPLLSMVFAKHIQLSMQFWISLTPYRLT